MPSGKRAWWVILASGGSGGLAFVTLLNHLGSSSLFSDEDYSWHAASGSIVEVLSRVRATENTPPLYYVALHLWIGVFGSGSVWGLRALSVLFAVAAVAATAWLGGLIGGPRVSFASGIAAAMSPLIVMYGQEIRAYAPVMAAAVLAAVAAIQVRANVRHQALWLVMATCMSLATVWLHYEGVLVAIVVALYIWTMPELGRRARVGHVAAVAAAFLIEAPIMVIQLRSGHQGGVAPYAKPTIVNLLRVVGTPFDGRFAPQTVTYLCGAAAVLTGFALLASSLGSRPVSREVLLVLAAATVPVGALIAVNIAAEVAHETSYYSLITRYTAVSAPFMLVSVGYAVIHLPPLGRILLVLVVGTACVSGLVGDYSRNTRWPDLSGAFALVSNSIRPGDAIVLDGYPAQGENSVYYIAGLEAHEHPRVIVGTQHLQGITAKRVWLVTDFGTSQTVSPQLARAGWAVVGTSQFYPDATAILTRPMRHGR